MDSFWAIAPSAASGRSQEAAGPNAQSQPARSAHHSGKPLINPRADLSRPPAGEPAAIAVGGESPTAEIGDGHRFPTWTGYAVQRFPEALASGDFNGDGWADVAYARSDFSAQGMSVQLNLGDGTMATSISYPATSESTDVKAGDLDGDGDLDLALISLGSGFDNVIDLYLNDGLGTFTRRTDRGGVGPQKMALADLDGDGDLDIAMSSGYFQNVMSVVMNDGVGTFGPERRYTVGDHPRGIAAADFDEDGDLDLALARNESATNKTKVQIWRNDGSANFAKAKEITSVHQSDLRP